MPVNMFLRVFQNNLFNVIRLPKTDIWKLTATKHSPLLSLLSHIMSRTTSSVQNTGHMLFKFVSNI